MPKLRIQPFHPSEVVIDGQLVRIRVARFDLDAYRVFRRDYARIEDGTSERPLRIRKPDEQATRPRLRPRTDVEARGAEQLEVLRSFISQCDDPASVFSGTEVAAELRGVAAALEALIPEESTDEVFVIPDDEIWERRWAEMTPDQRADYERVSNEEEAFAQAFIEREVIDHVQVEPGEIELEDADGVRSLTSGAELVKYFGARRDVMRELVRAIWIENTVDGVLKNAWRSLYGSGGSSTGRDRAAAGATPAPPAASARTAASAGSAAVTASTEDALSGSMVTSS